MKKTKYFRTTLAFMPVCGLATAAGWWASTTQQELFVTFQEKAPSSQSSKSSKNSDEISSNHPGATQSPDQAPQFPNLGTARIPGADKRQPSLLAIQGHKIPTTSYFFSGSAEQSLKATQIALEQSHLFQDFKRLGVPVSFAYPKASAQVQKLSLKKERLSPNDSMVLLKEGLVFSSVPIDDENSLVSVSFAKDILNLLGASSDQSSDANPLLSSMDLIPLSSQEMIVAGRSFLSYFDIKAETKSRLKDEVVAQLKSDSYDIVSISQDDTEILAKNNSDETAYFKIETSSSHPGFLLVNTQIQRPLSKSRLANDPSARQLLASLSVHSKEGMSHDN